MAPLWILLTLLPILGGAQRFNCKGRILGAYYADAKSGCKAFHVCVRVAGGGVRDFRFFCPPGTLFHQEAQTCTDWGDDDPLACPADIYDVYDTKKLSSTVNREEESEFGLQRAETGDRRLAQNNQNNANNAANDLRAAHSSDFFSGQRERGRDESAQTAAPARPAQSRQSFRRATTPRATSPTTQYTTPPPPPPPQPSSPSQYEVSKRKLVRKRPVYISTPAPTFPPNNVPQQSYNEQSQQSYKEQQQAFKEQQQQHKQQPYKQQQQQNQKPQQQQQTFKDQPQQPHKPQQQQQVYKEQPQPQQAYKQQQQKNQQQNFQPRFQQQPQNRPEITTPDVPPQYKEYKDEYVEVSRVTPKPNRYYPSNPTPLPSSYATAPSAQYNKKNGLAELYNYDAQSTPGLNVQQNDNNGQFKIKNSFNVAEAPKEDFARTRAQNNFNNGGRQHITTAVDYNAATRPVSTTQSYKNFNSVTYEQDKNSFVSFSKQSYHNPTTAPPATTTVYRTVRPEPPQNLNTIAYNTNIGFHSQSNFANPDEDDGQYRPPQGEDDGQYRPELYERELLSGAHSLNIAASGNRLPEDQQKKSYSKTQPPQKFTSQTAAPRPFRPAPTPTIPPRQTTNVPEYTTTVLPQTQRAFDLFQTYTTTVRPSEVPGGPPAFVPINDGPVRTTTVAPRAPETRPPRPQPRPAQAPTFPPAPAPRPTTHASPAAKPSNKEDASYDYAYYDSDPGFTEYDHIEEFGRTKKRA